MFVYKIGFEQEVLRVDGDVLIYTINSGCEKKIELQCNLSDRKMEIYSPTVDDYKRSKFDIVEKDIMDLDDNGERWEGSSFNDCPFGYGRLYNNENKLKYCGYMFEGRKICFGEEYYEDGKTLEYKGNFMNNMRHGRGILYDKEGLCVFEGSWHMGNSSSQLIIPFDCNDSYFFTDNVRVLIIENHCFTDLYSLHLDNNAVLEKLSIGRACFRKVTEFIIMKCLELRSVIIEEESFFNRNNDRRGQFIIDDCNKLELLEIKNGSFYHYDKFELKSDLIMIT